MSSIRRWVSDDEGAIAVIAAYLFGFALLGLAALATDIGMVAQERRQLQTAADAASLSAAQSLPKDPAAALTYADFYARKNAAHFTAVDTRFSDYGTFGPLRVTVTVDGLAPLGFARIWKKENQPARATATALVGSPSVYSQGVMPFGIMAKASQPPYGLAVGPGGEITLETGDGAQGNYHTIDLTDYTPGANNTKQVISAGGSALPISIGDIIDLQTGTPDVPNYGALNALFTCSHTFADLTQDPETGVYSAPSDGSGPCRRLMTFPVVKIDGLSEPQCYDWEETAGSSLDVQVLGFVNAFIEGSANPHTKTLSAKFVQVVDPDALDPGGYVEWAGIVIELVD